MDGTAAFPTPTDTICKVLVLVSLFLLGVFFILDGAATSHNPTDIICKALILMVVFLSGIFLVLGGMLGYRVLRDYEAR